MDWSWHGDVFRLVHFASGRFRRGRIVVVRGRGPGCSRASRDWSVRGALVFVEYGRRGAPAVV